MVVSAIRLTPNRGDASISLSRTYQVGRESLAISTDQRAELLGACRLFGGVVPADLVGLADRAVEVEYPADRVIVRQGEIGTGFFVITEGRVGVVRDGDELAILGPGEFFGELSVLDGKPRVAQVVSIEPTRCLALASWDLEAALMANPSIALAILRGLAERLRAKTEQQHH
jgi:CRP/FNR family cyclic AMP-dependent transcriptional regulator